MNIGIDMMGGDFAPLEAVKGVQQYLAKTENKDLFIALNFQELLDRTLDLAKEKNPKAPNLKNKLKLG